MASTYLVTPPAAEPISLEEAKAHLRVDGTDEDAFIQALIAGVREFAEGYCDRVFITQTWRMFLRSFAEEPVIRNGQIRLFYPTLQSVTHVKYRDQDGVVQTIDADEYVVDQYSVPATIEPAAGATWPTTQDHPQAVEIQYVAGFGDAADVPELLKRGMLTMVGHLFENRESVISGTIVGEVPQTLKFLLSQFRVPRFP